MFPLKARTSNFVLALLVFSSALKAQKSSITEKVQAFKTYPYSDPNRVPVMGIGKKVSPFYPYHVFDGYTNKSTTKNWKVVELENPYIKVQVLPEVGGKVMGAVEKSTGEEFVYTNHVMKFRAIGIRGPWTSGGIEHNFGLDLGHAPWAAAPVDYVMINNPDRSVTCVVGGIDLASRTQWRVKIVLPKDKAYFETQSLWYNPLPLHDSYLSWENAAFRASDDMQFFFPGTHHVGHDGLASPWPIDQNGVDLSYYKNVNSGGDKSYHVMGTHTSWFGGYWHNKNFGFGHWAPYSDAPGKKLWIWSRAREGAIWEDLLTDNDGQYIEAQSGVTFNQAAERSGFHSPFNQKNLGPFYSETKTEYWFPVKAAGGMVDASPYGTLNVVAGGDSLKIIINPISSIQDTLKVTAAGQVIYQAPLQLKPMEVYVKTIALAKSQTQQLRVSIGNDRLVYATQAEKILDRPVVSADKQDPHSAERLFELGEDENAMRNFEGAHLRFLECLKKEPTHSGALIRLAEYHYREDQYAEGVDFARKVLAENTYNGGANYLYGALYRKLGNLTKAEEALSVATWTMEYKSGAYAQLAGIALQKQDFEKAASDARKALDYNRNNLMAHQWLGTALRRLNKADQAAQVWKGLLDIDPLSHYAHFEQYLLNPTKENQAVFQDAIRNELPHETYLELAMDYVNQGQNQEAKQVLALAPAYPTVSYWLAYLNRDSALEESKKHLQNAIAMSPELVFPFRLETITVLQWAEKQQPSWKNRYYLGLIYWHIGDKENAKTQFAACKNEPDYAPFYIARGLFFQNDSAQADFIKANQLNPKEWRSWHYLTAFFEDQKLLDKALANAQTAYKQFPENPVIGIDYAKSLLNTGKFNASLNVLDKVNVLPQEGAREGHASYVTGHLAQALTLAEKKKYKDALQSLEKARLWPEHLGTGKPHEPDTRLMDYLAAYCETQLGHAQKAQQYNAQIADYTLNASKESNRNVLGNYLGIKLLRDAGKQELATKFLESWKAEQDSLRNWEITQGSDALEVQWILAKIQDDQARAEKLKQELTTDKNYNFTTLFFKILDLAEIRKKEDLSPNVYAQPSQHKAIIEDKMHYSEVFKENRNVRLILPPDYYAHPERRYPVIYYFHGNAGRFNGPAEGEVSRSGEARYYDEFNGNYERTGPDSLDNFASYVADNDVIIAKWDGYVPAQYPRPYDIAPVKEDRQFVDYFPEFVQYVDKHYRTKSYRESRAVSGLSMGGFMSMLVASKYPHLLSSASFFCPSASFTVGPKALQIYTPFKEMGRNFVGLPIRMHLGSKDFLRQHDQEIDDAFKTLELNYESWHYGIGYFRGFHNAVNIKSQFDFHMNYFRMPLPRPDKWHHIDLYPNFSVWNYNVNTNRNVPGFTLLNDVRKEGFSLQTKKWLPDGPSVPNLSVKIETDSLYKPNTDYDLIHLNVVSRKTSRSTVRSDKKGRIQYQGTGQDSDIGIYKNGDPGHITMATYSLNRKMPGVGDIVSLSPLLFNKGGAAVDSVRIELIAQDEEVEVIDPAVTIGKIAQGALHEKTAFKIRSRNANLDRAKLKLVLDYNGKKDPFLLEVPFYSPEKTLAEFDIADGRNVNLEVENQTRVGEGNSNGIANPGEWISIFTRSDLDSLHDFGLQLYTEDPYVDMESRRMLFLARADWSGAQRLTSQVQIKPDCPDGHEIKFYGIYEYPKNGNTRRDSHGAHSFIHETKRVSFTVKVKR